MERKRRRASLQQGGTTKRRRTAVDVADGEWTPAQEADAADLEVEEVPEDNVAVREHVLTVHRFSESECDLFRKRILSWYDENQRELPWRRRHVSGEDGGASDLTLRAYQVWVSEIMCQQTRIQTVIEYYKKWMKRFPDLPSLAAASLEDVNGMWAGLGYYRRAKYLHLGAKHVMEELGGVMPTTAEGLMKLPGIGQYTAGAIASIVFGEATPVVDGNVMRVLARTRLIGSDIRKKETTKLMWAASGDLVDPERPGCFNQAMMELGATVCTPTSPLCASCPVQSLCRVNALVSKQPKKKRKATALSSWLGAPSKADSKGGASSTLKKEEVADARESRHVVCEYCECNPSPPSVEYFPFKSKTTAPRNERAVVYVIECKQFNADNATAAKFLFVKRPEEGLLGGFWEPPMLSEVVVDKTDKASRKGSKDLDRGPYSIEDQRQSLERYMREELGVVLHEGSGQSVSEGEGGTIHLRVMRSRATGSVSHLFSHIKQNLHVYHYQVTQHGSASASHSKRTLMWMTRAEISSNAVSRGVHKCFETLKR